MTEPFPPKRYQIIYADPPWQVKAGPFQPTKGTNSPLTLSKLGLSKRPTKSLPLPYPTMTTEQIKALPVRDIADKDSHLYLWTINKYIRQAYDIAEAWGFKPSCLLTWCKTPKGLGLGGAFVQTSEHLLFCRRGTLKARKRIPTSWFHHKRKRHSEKPAMFRDMIVEVSGDLPRIELFARGHYVGWDVWGNEV